MPVLETSGKNKPRLSTVSPALEDEIAHLLDAEAGEEFFKRLFWEILSFERVNQPVPFSILPDAKRSLIANCKILAQSHNVYVCYFQMLVSELTKSSESAILRSAASEWPAALIIFTNLRGTEWDLCWQSAGLRTRSVRLSLDLTLYGLRKLARLLSGLSAADPVTGREFSSLELSRRFDQFFPKQISRKRERRKFDPFQAIFNSVGGWDLLSPEEEKELAKKWANERNVQARNRLIVSNLRLALKIAKKYQSHGPDLEDFFQEGCRGLIRATKTFDPSYGYKFVTYASHWVRNRVQRAAEIHRRYRRVVKGIDEETIDFSNFEEKRHNLFANPVEYHDLQMAVENALHFLDGRSQQVMRLRFGFEDGASHTLEQIGEILGLTRERVRQIESAAFSKLEPYLEQFVS